MDRVNVRAKPDIYAGTPPLESLKAAISIAANHTQTFYIMHIEVSRTYISAKAERPVLVRLPSEYKMGVDAGEMGYRQKTCMAKVTQPTTG